jgi:hypothetical protein
LSAVILFFFVIFVVNQTAQLVSLADRVSPAFGTAVLWLLLGLYAALILATAAFLLRLPKALVPPATEVEPEFSRYLDALRKRLAANPRLKGHDLSDRAGIENALAALGRECDAVIRDSAAAVFVSTAISQSGRLDTIFVLTAHFRMVWRIASIYSQRPALRELIHLYANVAATAFVAGELDEAEIGEQVEPILSSALGAVSLSVPGMQAAASIVITSISRGRKSLSHAARGDHRRGWCCSLVVADRLTLADRPRTRREAPGADRQNGHGAHFASPLGRLEVKGRRGALGALGFARDIRIPPRPAKIRGRRMRSDAHEANKGNSAAGPIVALVFISLIWGYNWVVMKESLRYAGPFDFNALRMALGSVFLFAFMAWKREPLRPPFPAGTAVLGLTNGPRTGLIVWPSRRRGRQDLDPRLHHALLDPLLPGSSGRKVRATSGSPRLAFCRLNCILEPWASGTTQARISPSFRGVLGRGAVIVKLLQRPLPQADLIRVTTGSSSSGPCRLFPSPSWCLRRPSTGRPTSSARSSTIPCSSAGWPFCCGPTSSTASRRGWQASGRLPCPSWA